VSGFTDLSTIGRLVVAASLLATISLTGGCGTTRDYSATEQLVVSDAVDRSIGGIDFRPMSGRKVYLDTSYLRHIKGGGFVNAEYATSALRQQIVAAGCRLQDSSQSADVIIEARIGTLGSDDHGVTLGVPENKGSGNAVSVSPGAPSLGVIPEIAFARREAREAAAKVAAFAYDRVTREPIWQSGSEPAHATARDTWVLGVGPFQGGSIRERTKLAGSRFAFGRRHRGGSSDQMYDRPPVAHTAMTRFQQGWPLMDGDAIQGDLIGDDSAVELAGGEVEIDPTSPSKDEKPAVEKTHVKRADVKQAQSTTPILARRGDYKDDKRAAKP